MPETGQSNNQDKTRILRDEEGDNQDPGVNSEDEDEEPQVYCPS